MQEHGFPSFIVTELSLQYLMQWRIELSLVLTKIVEIANVDAECTIEPVC